MAFPRRFLGISIGWMDRGEASSWVAGGMLFKELCPACHVRVHIGIEDKQPFKFCPKCLMKLNWLVKQAPNFLKFDPAKKE